MAVTFGLDISHHQSRSLSLAQCRRDGCEFVFLKSSEGASFTDPAFGANLAEARAAGMLVAAYHFVRGDSAASQVARISGVVPRDVPVIPDVEDGTVPLVHDLVNRLRDAGYTVPFTYFPRWYWEQLGSPSLAGLPPLWASRYPDMVVGGLHDEFADVPAYFWDGFGGLGVAILQFTSTARIGGYQPLDANAFRGTRAELADRLRQDGSTGEDDDMATCTLTLPPGENLTRTIPLVGLPPYVYFFTEAEEPVRLHQVDFVKANDENSDEPSFVGELQVTDWEVQPNRPGPWKPGHIPEAVKRGAVGMCIRYSSATPFVAHVG